MTDELTVPGADGGDLRVHDTGPPHGWADAAATVVWHHGTPHTGAPLPPIVRAAARRGVRLVTYARPGYQGSTSRPGRDVASAARDVSAIADALDLDQFAVAGYSGGGSHALACAALLPGRVTAAVCLSAIAPVTVDFNWYAGMAAPSALRAAAAGRAARARFAETEQFDPAMFTDADWAALSGAWACLGEDAQAAEADGPVGAIDDDVAYASPWGFDLAAVDVPALLVQGGQDRVVPPAHADWLLRRLPRPQLWLRPADGHVSVLGAAPVALDWLLACDPRPPLARLDG